MLHHMETSVANRKPSGAGLPEYQPPRVLTDLLADTGVRLNGQRPWDIQVNDPRAYGRVLRHGSLGFGEAYMDGLWDCPQLDEMFTRLLRTDINNKLRHHTLRLLLASLGSRLLYRLHNRQAKQRAYEVGKRHYDIGNDIYQAMLDPTLSYSCGYWARADNLADAQQAKLDLICRKLDLQPGERLLDIGCGWGGLAQYAACRYGVEVLGITVSREQQKLATARCAGLPVQIEFMDYRALQGQFQKIVSVGMFEHVGPKNYQTYFDTVHRLLADDGLFLLHTIGDFESSNINDPWLARYIFPNSVLPGAQQIAAALEPRLIFHDWHNFGLDYDRTLMAWWENFQSAWPSLSQRYDQRFYRMWQYYLHSCAGLFRAGQGQLWQLVISKRAQRRDYRSVR
jgi:cyclopropane-fatty-acyl-phospholipid synthase